MSARPESLDALAVALDTADRDIFSAWCGIFGPRVGVLKVGLESFVRFGAAAVAEARQTGARVFLDLKLHDIPNTVAGSVDAAGALGVDYLTIHAGGGPAMIEAAARAAAGRVGILAVTLLTSLDQSELTRLDLPGTAAERVLSWSRIARDAGAAGVVCSPLEVSRLRAELPRPFVLVTPGIRPQGCPAGDQRRTSTPAAALAAGADLLVIGRPLTAAPEPAAALAALERELAGSGWSGSG